ncbi:MAG: peptidyl-prolyl cis-trans isomerase [Ignavibacteriae bacterium]|nr:MAG: peptidyl-prolyl cis-trans isomerase [Ignavibacteriota bacterium]
MQSHFSKLSGESIPDNSCRGKVVGDTFTRQLLFAFSLFLLFLSPPLAAQPAGIVNGDTIWLESYSREVGRRAQLNMQTRSLSASDVLQTTWLDMVDDVLLWQESGRRGIDVTPKQVDSVLLNATPDCVKRGVLNDKAVFDAQLLKAMLTAPDSLIRARGRNLTADQVAEQSAQLRNSMNELRGRTANVIRIQRLRTSVEQLAPVDSAALRKSFEDAATTVTADMVYVPCAPYTGTPSDAEIEAWYKRYPDRYRSDDEMRRMAFLNWAMTASPVDSALILNNVKSFVTLLNATKNKVKRDSIWNSVAETVSAGVVRLHPDSAAHKEFYPAVKGAKVGAAVGPIPHYSGVHVLLVDSIIGKVYVVRAAVTDVDPSQETVDSILSEVNTAVEMYERGKTFGELSQTFNRPIEFTPFFKRGDQVFASYRLVDVAFKTQLTAMCDPVDAPDRGVIIGVVTDSIPPGPMPIDAVRDQISLEVKTDMACSVMERDIKSLNSIVTRLDNGSMLVGAPIKDGTILRDITIDPSGLMGEQFYDPLAARAVCNASGPGLMGPFRGDAGWYMVNIRSITRPNPDDYPLYLQLRGEDLVAEQRARNWDTWRAAVRKNAKIEDMRWMYFRY